MESVTSCIRLFLLISLCSATTLPDYVTKCSKGDAKVSDCVKDNTVVMIPKIINGDDTLKIPNLNPLKIKEVNIAATDSLKIKLQDIEVSGLEKTVFKDVKIDIDKKTASSEAFIEELKIDGTYDIDGKILVLPITGHGPAHITFEKILFTLSFEWDLVDKDGTEYAEIKNDKLTYTTERQRYHLDDLFNGDKELGDQMNAFLDENWEEFGKDISPAVSKTISSTVMGIAKSLSDNISWKDLWSD